MASKPIGIYLIQEVGCINPHSGAYQHISMGVQQLSHHFNIETYLATKPINLATRVSVKTNASGKPAVIAKNPLRGTIKDVLSLLSNVKNSYKLIKLLKSKKIDFVYERAAYMNFSGLIACKFSGIPHFYESNGLQFEGQKSYYRSLFTKLSRIFEKMAYSYATHTFFVGSYGDYWQIDKDNWTNVENGIEQDKVVPYQKKTLNKETLQICFIGKFMKHQRLDILLDALKIIGANNAIKVHLIGGDLGSIENEIKNIGISVENHSFVDRSKIISLIINFDVGIICGSPEYQSCMKLFDYAAAGCAVVAPEIHNLKVWFPNEVCYFDGKPKDFANKLLYLKENRNILNGYGKSIFETVTNNFSWKNIFELKVSIIKSNLNT